MAYLTGCLDYFVDVTEQRGKPQGHQEEEIYQPPSNNGGGGFRPVLRPKEDGCSCISYRLLCADLGVQSRPTRSF
jgi:hypothetical protein